jgi:hypothetical protein
MSSITGTAGSRFTVCVWSRLDGAWRTVGDRGETFTSSAVDAMKARGWNVRAIPVDVFGPAARTERLLEVERMAEATRRVCMMASDRAAQLRSLQALRARVAGGAA